VFDVSGTAAPGGLDLQGGGDLRLDAAVVGDGPQAVDSPLPLDISADSDAPLLDTRLDLPPLPDAPTADTSVPPDTQSPSDIVPPHSPPWWDPAYSYRRPLTIVENAAGSLPAGYSVVLKGFDTQSLVSTSKTKATGDDLRVVRWDGSANNELDRRILAMNGAGTRIWFKTQNSITGASTDHFLYYGNSLSGGPPSYWSDSMGADAPSKVYLAADDFQEHSQGDCPDGWGTCGSGWLVEQSGSIRHLVTTQSTSGQYLFAGSAAWTDVTVEARVKSDDPDGCPGIASRVEDTQNLVYSGYNCATNPMPPTNVAVWPRVNGSYTPLIYQGISTATGWHTIRVAWRSREVSLYHDDTFINKANAPTAVDLSGKVGLFSTYATKLYADDVIVRLFVDPEPTVSVGSEEPYTP
jgi:hypothetical protein